MRTRFRIQALLFVFVLLLVWLAVPVPAKAVTWQEIYSRFKATAGETLATGDVVCIKGSDGKAYKADANDSNLRPAVGVIGKGGASGATVEVIIEGIISGMSAKSPGATLYLSETAGAFTAVRPANEQTLGWVLPGIAGIPSSTTYYIRIETIKTPGAGY